MRLDKLGIESGLPTIKLAACLCMMASLGCAATETGVGSEVAGCESREYGATLDQMFALGTTQDIIDPVVGSESATGAWLESGEEAEATVIFSLRDVQRLKVEESLPGPDAGNDVTVEQCGGLSTEAPFHVQLSVGSDVDVVADFSETVTLPSYGLTHTWYVDRASIAGPLSARTEFEQIRIFVAFVDCESCVSGRRVMGQLRGIPPDAHTGPREPCAILADGGSECPDYGETDLFYFTTDVPTPDASLEASTFEDAGADAGI